jgi:4-hydroxymandelate oxidase
MAFTDHELETRARTILPAAVFDLFAGGAGEEQTLRDNVDAWRHVWLVPRQLTGAGEPDPSVTLLGRRLSLPVVLAPVAAQRLLHPGGEPAAARGAAAAGTVFCLSTRATADLGEVAAAAPQGGRWFQLYMGHDRDEVRRVLARLADHGYEQVVLTIDLPVAGRRQRELRHGAVGLPAGVTMTDHLGAGAGVAGDTKPPVGGWAPVTWEDVAWVSEASGLPVVVKGVLHAADAELALAAGASAVIVSNHGARQLDGSVPTAVALPAVSAAVRGRVPVLVDGGVRIGSDVARALALGADAVMIGRPYAWALAAGGQEGVADLLRALRDDFARTLTLLGVTSAAGLGAHHVKLRGWG